jgi:hypothetical protein
MDILESDILEMDLGAMAISEFQYIHSDKNRHIGNGHIINGFRCYGYIRIPIYP